MKELNDVKKWDKYWTPKRRGTPIGWFNRTSYLLLTVRALRELGLSKDASILDVGCGSGGTLTAFRRLGFKNSFGIDYSSQSIKSCERLGFQKNKDIYFGNAEHTSFPNNSFDVIFSEGILEHFADFSPLAKEMVRITKGYIILIQPNHFSVYGRILKLLWFLSQRAFGGVKEISYRLPEFQKTFNKYGARLAKIYLPPLQSHWVLCFSKERTFQREKSWKEAQKLESAYAKNLEDKIWKIPHSLEYWTNFLLLEDIKGQGLEVGCGNHGLYNFTENVVGLDPINFHKRNFIKSVGEHLPIKNVDFVVCCNGIDHCKDPRKVLEEMFRVTNKVVLWVWVHPRFVSWFMKKIDKMHPYHLTKNELEGLLDNFSVKVTKKKVYTPLWHWKYTDNWKVRTKLLFAYILGVRGLCLHLEREPWT